MPAPVPQPVRQAMRSRWEGGASATELGLAFGVPVRTVRDLVRRVRGPRPASPPTMSVDPARRRPRTTRPTRPPCCCAASTPPGAPA